MSIDLFLEVEQDVLYPPENPWGSKVLEGFVTAAFHYCDLTQATTSPVALEDWQQEIIGWFGPIAAAANADLCVLANAWYGEWPYRTDQYEEYVADFTVPGTQEDPFLTQEYFLMLCQEVEAKWADIHALRRALNSVIDVLKQLQPPEIWWYFETDTRDGLAELSDVLAAALEAGYTRARLTSR